MEVNSLKKDSVAKWGSGETDDKKLRSLLTGAEAMAQLAIESFDAGTYDIDLLTDETVTSARFNNILGAEAPLVSSDFRKLIHPDDHAIRDSAHDECAKTGRLFYEARVCPKGGSERWMRVIGKVLYDDGGKPVRHIGLVKEIASIRRPAEELTRLVQAPNEELVATNEELSEANERLIKANQDLEQFAFVASHDLQEPLRKIQTFSNLLNERYGFEMPEGALVYLEKIGLSATRMSNLIKDLLDYARRANNRPVFQVVDLNTVLNNVTMDFELLIHQKKVVIKTDQLPTIEAVPFQMNQLFYNLIGNSLKFLRKGVEPLITIRSRSLSDDEIRMYPGLKSGLQYGAITVSDNGSGFSQQYAEQIFGIFQQLNNKSVYGGYGIGLSLKTSSLYLQNIRNHMDNI